MAEIRNPNAPQQGNGAPGNSGGDMRYVLLFTSLGLAAMLAWQTFFKKPEPAPQPAPTAATQQQAAATAPAVPSNEPAIVAQGESKTVVENAFYRITFSNKGAQAISWILKNYKDSAGHPLDLINQSASPQYGLPLSLFTYEPALTTQLNQALYVASATGQLTAPAQLSFHYEQNGLDVTKTIAFDSSYVLHVATKVTRNGSPVRALIQWPSGLGDQEEFNQYAAGQFAWSSDGKNDTTTAAKVSSGATFNQSYDYAAVTDLFFGAAFLPDNPERSTVVTLNNSIQAPRDAEEKNSPRAAAPLLGVALGDTTGTTSLRVYAGPKQIDTLATVHATGSSVTLKSLVQFGWSRLISEPLFIVLRFFYTHGVGNWGWSIVIVTVLFNLIMLPTRINMMKSSLKMARIQPRIDAIKRKYANLKINDPKRQEMNVETMKLYKEEGINMYGNCLPILIQMPLFYGYYRVLANIVELRQAHWLWLNDLAHPDPWKILPIFIICSMSLVQFITPSPGMDPAQRRMMAVIFPIVWGFTMFKFPSGLALYWATGNLINLIIQLSINRSKLGKEMHALAAKRAQKQSNKTIQGRR